MEKVSAIIVKGEWRKGNTIKFKTFQGYYPFENGEMGFFVTEKIREEGVTGFIEDDMEDEYFYNKYRGEVDKIGTSII